MELDWSDKKSEDNIIWIDSEGSENDDFSNYKSKDQSGFKTKGSYSTDQSQNPRSGYFWERGYGPAGPPNQQSFPGENDTETFLLHCGVMKSVLRGLPKALLQLMKPEYCGVCAHQFVNLDAARLHYMSKNHIRNQKKWVIQQAKVGSKRPSEIPMRSRQLYCELCDIRITSKTHAESHYGGRQHRAIVEGRKFPKNPFLLQKNMHARVEKLILREKGYLKTVKFAARKLPRTVPTPIKPELYCEICKSAASSSDQMTMHLNGKRHLTKEKQHILMMMKSGETIIKPKPEPADTSATAKDADVADAQSANDWEEWETNTYEDESDWGHGSGTWDDDPQ